MCMFFVQLSYNETKQKHLEKKKENIFMCLNNSAAESAILIDKLILFMAL